jgi:hypothetical protein
MFRGIRVPLRSIRPTIVPRTFYRPLAVAAEQPTIDPSISPKLGATMSFLDDEPKGPKVITEIPGPKVKAAKAAMGKIQDVCLSITSTHIDSCREYHGVRSRH